MAKSTNQKLKILYLMKILLDRTDEEHRMSLKEIIASLGEYDIAAERKSVYDDMEALKAYGVDIEGAKDKTGYGYYVNSRLFEMPELKLLVDVVQSSKFITYKKSEQLIKKVESLASNHDIRRNVVCGTTRNGFFNGGQKCRRIC